MRSSCSKGRYVWILCLVHSFRQLERTAAFIQISGELRRALSSCGLSASSQGLSVCSSHSATVEWRSFSSHEPVPVFVVRPQMSVASCIKGREMETSRENERVEYLLGINSTRICSQYIIIIMINKVLFQQYLLVHLFYRNWTPKQRAAHTVLKNKELRINTEWFETFPDFKLKKKKKNCFSVHKNNETTINELTVNMCDTHTKDSINLADT